MDGPEKPSKLTTAAILMMVSGCINIITSFGSIITIIVLGTVFGVLTMGFGFLLCCCIVLPLLFFTWGILEIIYSIRLNKGRGVTAPPYWIAIGEIVIGFLGISSITGIIVFTIGVINTVLFLDPEVKKYFEGLKNTGQNVDQDTETV